jgi:polysaccharide pyruvyl transferase WcaK-like protein
VKQAETRIGLLHHVGGGNLGDDATLESVADGIRQRWSQAEIVAFSMNPDDTETRHVIKSYPIRRNCWSIGYKSAAADGTFKAGVSLTRNRQQLRNQFDGLFRNSLNKCA